MKASVTRFIAPLLAAGAATAAARLAVRRDRDDLRGEAAVVTGASRASACCWPASWPGIPARWSSARVTAMSWIVRAPSFAPRAPR